MPTMPNLQECAYRIEDYDPAGAPVERVRTAQALVQAALTILDQVARETKDRHAGAYLVDHLAILASSNHGFLSRDFTLDDWIEQLEEQGDADTDER